MIQNKTARKLLYKWNHNLTSAMYAAASTGMVASWDALEHEINKLRGRDAFKRGDNMGTIAADKLMEWVAMKKKNTKNIKNEYMGIMGIYSMLPWF